MSDKKVFFMVNAGEISPDKSGGASVYYSHIQLLHAIGYQVHLIVCIWDNITKYNPKDYQKVQDHIKEITPFYTVETPGNKGFKRLYYALVDPLRFEYAFLNRKNLNNLRQLLHAQKYDLVWCEWRWTAILYARLKEKVKAIYSHHDWEYKLAKHKNRDTIKQKFHQFQKKRGEFSLVKSFTASVSGSYTESIEIEKITKKKALYLPTTYVTKKTVKEIGETSLVHLGGMNTTANRIGLERFLDVCWKRIKQSHPTIKLKVVGSMSHATPSLLEKVKDHAIKVEGFVEDLNTVMYSSDIHIIPWEYNTGTRTRLPVALNFEQAVVATKASIKAFPEMINDKNVLLCDTLEDMTVKIKSLLENPEKRAYLGKAGKETFLDTFTLNGQLKKFETFIESI
ncbi:glycosyltransferase [Flavobacteriaceae bacterium S356]|uniref:Glycosyltransferase n=1 Tax=Asprobacillus argus TaxID=3076534 RepID=A0ABU3LEC4_9FLAO|nr:glycosyltransferase [Flavobacteriaceae bacterium S356]